MKAQQVLHHHATIQLAAGKLRIVAVADTHGRPHPKLATRIHALAPGHIVHAGDVGDLAVLRDLERHAPVTAVRGNIDRWDLPDLVTIEVRTAETLLLKMLVMHCALQGPNLRADAAQVARAEGATIIVCGHSHVPFAGSDHGIRVFNPGSAGPRRFRLPVVLGVIDLSAAGISLQHVACETGLPWEA
jgi:putative phosphoesterase